MKKLLFLAFAACAFQLTACGQKAADTQTTAETQETSEAPKASVPDNGNCKMIHTIMDTLETANMDLKSFRDKALQGDTFKSNVTLVGFDRTFIVDEARMSVMLLAKMPPFPTKEAAEKAYNDLIQQIRACIDTKKYQEGKEMFGTGVLFSPSLEEGEAMVSVILREPYEPGSPYEVELHVSKNKPVE